MGECPVLESRVSDTLELGRVGRHQRDSERPCVRRDEESSLNRERFPRPHHGSTLRRHFASAVAIHAVRATQYDGVVDAVLDVRSWVGVAKETLDVGVVLRKQQRRFSAILGRTYHQRFAQLGVMGTGSARRRDIDRVTVRAVAP